MNYYKIIKNNTFIGVISSNNFRGYSRKQHFLCPTTENDGEIVSYMQIYYRDTWMKQLPEDFPYEYISATILSITKEEYDNLNIKLEDNAEQTILEQSAALQPTEEPIEISTTNPYDILTVEEMKKLKLTQLSSQCRTIIENGFNLELRGETHHFSLDTQDQLNLISLSAMAQTQSMIPYHADGEMCIFYTAEEINEIVETATAFKVYHTTYYNALKGYINALNTIEEISAVEYGDPIPEEYQSDVLKALIV